MHEFPSRRQLLLAVLVATTLSAAVEGVWSYSGAVSPPARVLLTAAVGLLISGTLALLLLRTRERAHRARDAALRSADDASALRAAVMDVTPVGFAFFDRELRYVHINTALAAMHGLPAERHLGRHVTEVMPDLGKRIAPRLQLALSTGASIQDTLLQVETPAAPGESRFWFGSYLRVCGANGEVLGVIAAMSELTERMRAEKSLQEHEGRLDVLTRSLPDYLWGGKLRGGRLREFYCTPVIERTTGYAASAFVQPAPDGGPPPLWAEMIHPEDRARYRAGIEGRPPAPRRSWSTGSSAPTAACGGCAAAPPLPRWMRRRSCMSAASSPTSPTGGSRMTCASACMTASAAPPRNGAAPSTRWPRR
ncbi:PAS domain-containing protein [Myxococcus sp. MxC21-1]|uniref:PAS domain-containing protein n=1 Tax=Myxococcus sp. MxC21-1 TaxID=3041439 RepID=UPI00292F5948|nr:PAS domain-containing protein [Myxococcus sp. MxC21-1]WNZ58948.1 PAS domain-containing protein [Myxococcus sp. MxC21-1]